MTSYLAQVILDIKVGRKESIQFNFRYHKINIFIFSDMFYALAIVYSTIFCTLYRLIIAVDVIDPYNYEYKVEGDQYRVGEMYEYSAEGAYKVPLPDAVKQVVIYSVSGENSGYAGKVSYQTEGRGKHGENKVEERKPNNN